jgi:hypothetical protein
MFRELFAKAEDIVFFSISLGGWGATIVFTLLASWLDTFALRWQIKAENNFFKKSQVDREVEPTSLPKNPWDKWTVLFINPLIAICFCTGLLFLTLFFFSNFPNNIKVN